LGISKGFSAKNPMVRAIHNVLIKKMISIMLVFFTINELKKHLNGLKSQKKTLGFVPTMGALHEGHLSLVKIAKSQCDYVIASIFVNPLQFNDKKDLDKYPHMPGPDKKMLEDAGCDILFSPSNEEMYPVKTEEIFDLGSLDKTMEGAQRPGHFNGVATVVKRLFEIVKPDKAFFGQKDFQQLAIVKRLVQLLDLDVEIIACPIIREADGLAMSSRNTRLSPDQRKIAPLLSRVLFQVKKMKDASLDEKKEFVKNEFSRQPEIHLEYFEIVNGKTLEPLKKLDPADHPVACIAAKIGDVRLIDNIILFD
jgi:pantoate--beta-alanine ligase